MKRKTGFVFLAAMALSLALLLIPTTQAERTRKSLVVPKTDAAQLAKTKSPGELATSNDKGWTNVAGEPPILNSQSPLSAALFTAIGGVNTSFDEVSLLGNWDGREDYTADRAQKIDDLSFVAVTPTQFVTRTAISEHTRANGFDENVYYEGDSEGKFYVGTDVNPGINTTASPSIDSVMTVNIPQLVNTGTSGGFALLNPVGGDTASPSVVVTGVAVNPVAELSDFTGVACDTIGEVVYVSVLDAGGAFKTRIFAFAFTDTAGGVLQHGVLQLLRNSLSNSGIAVD